MRLTIYKKLYEIRILHDYFLAGEDGVPFFETKPTQNGTREQAREKKLEDVLASRRYDISRFLTIVPDEKTRQLFQNARIKMVKGPLGFFLGMEVKRTSEGANTFYEPFIPLDPKDAAVFILKANDELFHSYTNLALENGHLPARWIFTNAFEQGMKEPSLPVLSAAIPPKNMGGDFRMGDLVKDGGEVQEVIVKRLNNQDIRQFLTLQEGADGFVNRRDKVLLPHRFRFDFKQSIQGPALFELKLGSETIKTIAKGPGEVFRFANLDFRQKDGAGGTFIAEGMYSLHVTANGNTATHRVYLSEEKYSSTNFGVIEIKPFAGHPNLDLLDGNGRFLERIENGIRQPHRIFELRFQSRRAYWRYKKKGGFDGAGNLGAFLQWNAVDKSLATIEPRHFSQVLMVFKNGNTVKYLPNAQPHYLKYEQAKYFSDILVSLVNPMKMD